LTDPSVQRYVDATTVDGVRYWYAVTAVDDTSPVGNENRIVGCVGPAVSSPNFDFTYAAGHNLMSIGADTPETDMATLLGIEASELQLARWDPNSAAYVTYEDSPTSSFLENALGRAFWLLAPRTFRVSVAGQPAGEGNFKVAFSSGWNMIGNPYTARMSTVGMTVDAAGRKDIGLAEACSLGWICDYMWAYDGSSYKLVSPSISGSFVRETIDQGRGVFIRAFVSGELSLPRPSGAALPAEKPADAGGLSAEWKLRLVAESAGGCDVDNFAGTSSDAAALNAIVSPPMQGVDLYFVNAGGAHTAAAFADSKAADASCTAEVAVEKEGPVTLRWPDLSELPNDVRPVLVDTATGKRLYMRTTGSYTYDADPDAPRRFKLQMRTDGAGALVVQGLAAAPAEHGAQIAFTLSQDAAVTVEILNVAGRPIRTVATGLPVGAAEAKTLVWDGSSNLGTKAPAGRYLVRVLAQTDDGQQVSAMGSVSLRR